jgi:hypothetical protein
MLSPGLYSDKLGFYSEKPDNCPIAAAAAQAGYKQLEQLSERWDVYAGAGDGDVVRRLLGEFGL